MKLIWQISGQPSSTTGHEGDEETCDKKHEPELVKSPRAESKDVHEADIPSLREVDLSPRVHCEEAVSGGNQHQTIFRPNRQCCKRETTTGNDGPCTQQYGGECETRKSEQVWMWTYKSGVTRSRD